jgi:hypothetical protein
LIAPGERAPTTTVSRGLPYKDRHVCVLSAEADVTITDPDTYSDTIISGNSANDPFIGFGSAQPVFYDQLGGLYNRYRVIASRVEVTLTNVGGSGANVNSVTVAVCPTAGNGAFSNLADIMAQPWVRYKTCNPEIMNPKVFSVRMCTEHIEGDTVRVNNSLGALTTANPSEEWYWHIGAQSKVTGTSISVALKIKWIGEVEFYARATQAQSLEERLKQQRLAREAYLVLKSKTPGGTGRLPKKEPLFELKEYVESLPTDDGWDEVQYRTKLGNVLSKPYIAVPPPPTPSDRKEQKKSSAK